MLLFTHNLISFLYVFTHTYTHTRTLTLDLLLPTMTTSDNNNICASLSLDHHRLLSIYHSPLPPPVTTTTTSPASVVTVRFRGIRSKGNRFSGIHSRGNHSKGNKYKGFAPKVFASNQGFSLQRYDTHSTYFIEIFYRLFLKLDIVKKSCDKKCQLQQINLGKLYYHTVYIEKAGITSHNAHCRRHSDKPPSSSISVFVPKVFKYV